MKILLTGASGFIGNRLLRALLAAGHDVLCPVRRPDALLAPGAKVVMLDFNQAVKAQDWQTAVSDIDVAINAVGIFQETAHQRFDTLHRAAPCALFDAAAAAGVRHVVQISALGADADARTAYHLSKKAADDHLASLPVRASIVQPSLVYGPGGASARFFEMMASMPLIPLPSTGGQRVQPVHVDDLVAAVCALVQSSGSDTARIPMVGPEALTLRDYLRDLRRGMGIRRGPRFLFIPAPMVALAARLGSRLPGGFLDPDALSMLQRGNTGPSAAIAGLLGRPPQPAHAFIPAEYRAAVSTQARMSWLLVLLRLSIALVWIVTGIVSLGLYPVEDSYALLAQTGTPQWLMPVFLYGAALLDIVLGILTLHPRRRRWIWLAQASLVLLYTVIITIKIPEFWLHPYGPILKNLPFLAALWILYELEDRTWNT